MSNLPFPVKPGEQPYHMASARVWHGEEKLLTVYQVYLTTHRLLGIDGNGRIAFNHFFQDIGSVEVTKTFWRDPGLRVVMKNGTALHLALVDERKQDGTQTATRWANLVQGHMLNLGG